MMRNWNRREFTRNTAMLALFAPFISLIDPKVAHAQTPGAAKYLLIIVSNGTEPGAWNPAGSSAGNIVFSEMLQPLTPIKNDVILLNNFDSKGSAGSHGAIGAITGSGQYDQRLLSLDQWVADDLRSRGILTQVPSVHLGGVGGNGGAAQPGIAFRNNSLLSPTFSLTQAFTNIFDGTAPPPPPPAAGEPAPTGPSAEEIRLLRRQSILDVVKDDITQLERSLGGLEREKLQIHADSIRQLEERIAQQLAIAGGTVDQQPTQPNQPAQQFVVPVACNEPSNLAGGLQPIENSRVHLSMAITAFSCDVTRVALVEFGHHQSCNVNIPGAQGDWHNDFMHAQGSPRTKLIAVEQYMSERIVEAVNQLKATQAPDGSSNLYEQTYILWAREMGDAVVHAGNNMPFVVAGGAGGYLRNGNSYLSGGGAAHLQVLASAAQAMGATNLSTLGGPNAPAGDRTPFPGLRG